MDRPRVTGVSFRVLGTPAPKGSYRIVGTGKRSRVIPDNEATKPWETAVGWHAKIAMRAHAPFANRALAARLTFYLPRPPSVTDAWPQTKPDIDKLTRATFDAMEGIVFDNDSRVVELEVSKHYARVDEPPGCFVAVDAMEAA